MTLDSVFRSHGFQKEAMVQEYLRVRRKAQEDYKQEEAEDDVRNFLSGDNARRDAAARLALDSTSPVVSRETQLAFLKQLILDFTKGKKRPGLSALTALKAVELINKMAAYDAPEKVEHVHEHKVNVLPIIAQPFEGALPPLKVYDVMNEEEGIIDAIAVSDSDTSKDSETKALTPEDF
jgi:hypothetical protein